MKVPRKNRQPRVKSLTVRHIPTASPFDETIGYSRAVVSDSWVFVAGTTGYDYAKMVMPDSIKAQCRNALATIDKALQEAGSGARPCCAGHLHRA
ncbi:Rid family hydrolase [Yoonia sp.]|uniref:Rid family hydrolase n=1 Tax=Yoonia sp. TaxID=2212373 RepID=UPI003975338C